MKPITSVITKNVFDSMERSIASPLGENNEQRENPTPKALNTNKKISANDECWVAEGRSPDLEGVREAQHGEK